jgi:HPt (histidine-containing phosphotransfer) domain-containing protein
VDDSLSVSLQSLRQCDEAQPLHLALHDLKGYLGMVAAPELTDWVKAADQLARSGQLSEALAQLAPLLPRLQALQACLRAYRAGIIDG